MSYTLQEFEEYLMRKNPGKYDNIESNVYPATARQRQRKNRVAPKVSTQSDTVRPWDVAQTENSFYTGSQNSGIMGQNDNSDPYAIQEPRQVPYTNPDDIPRGNNPNDYVYKSTQSAPTNDPHGKTWTDEQEKRKRLQDATIERDNLLKSFVGMPTTEVVVKLGAFDDEIAQLSQELGVTDSASVPTTTEPIPEHSLPAPKVPTMTAPIPENSQPDEQSGNSDPYAIQEPRQAPYSNPYDIPGDYNPNDYVYPSEQTPVYTNPYDIPSDGTEHSTPEEPYVNTDPYAIPEKRQAPYTNPYDIPRDYSPNDYVSVDEQTPVYTNPYDIPREEYAWQFVSKDEYVNVVDYDNQVEVLEEELDKLDKEAYDFYKYLGDTLYYDKHEEYTEEYYKRIGEIKRINTELRDLEGRREKSTEEEKYNGSKFELKGDVVIETSRIDGAGEPVSIETMYFSQDSARLLINPEPIIKLSENTGLTRKEILDWANGLLDVGVGTAELLGATSGLGGLAVMLSVLNLGYMALEKFDIYPKIDDALSRCEEGDYIYPYRN